MAYRKVSCLSRFPSSATAREVVSVPSLCMCGASVYETHHKFVHLFFHLCTSIRLYCTSYPLPHLSRSAILGTLKRSRPYSSSSSNRRHAHSDAVVEPRFMSLIYRSFKVFSRIADFPTFNFSYRCKHLTTADDT